MLDPKCLHQLSYGLYVVSSRAGEHLNGQVANTVFQVSNDPPSVAVMLVPIQHDGEYGQESGRR
ncbi:MAG: flavin reductase [Bacillota bacterium]